jgi:molybdenum cofactor guanylyltransferase
MIGCARGFLGYDRGVNDLSAFVLAGGKSTRMGRDKAFLYWGKGSFLEHALELAGRLTTSVSIVGDAKKFAGYGVPVIVDIYPARGPLGGIHAALSTTAAPWNLILAVDLPLITSPLLSYLVERAEESDATVTVANAGGDLQPLCAVYRREFAEIAERALCAGQNKIDSLFQEVRTQLIEEEMLLRAGFSAEMFRNLNTPEELEDARRSPLAESG